jgi:hypothetical protein
MLRLLLFYANHLYYLLYIIICQYFDSISPFGGFRKIMDKTSFLISTYSFNLFFLYMFHHLQFNFYHDQKTFFPPNGICLKIKKRTHESPLNALEYQYHLIFMAHRRSAMKNNVLH